jgi:hypothetical protein
LENQLQLYAQEALDELNAIKQEIPIAIHMQELERQREMKGGSTQGPEHVRGSHSSLLTALDLF